MAKDHSDAGVKILNKESVKKIIGNEQGGVRGIELESGTCIDSDLVILGTGVRPATDFIQGTGIKMQPDGSIECNPFL